MKNIIFIGMPGAGKSTVGVVIAKMLGYDFIDCDLIIQKQTGKLLCESIAELGPLGFLALEDRINSEINVTNSVISTGGSAIYGENSMTHFKKIGKVVYLKLSYDSISKRLGDLTKRGVVLKDGQNLESAYIERCILCEQYADIVVECDGLTIEETIEKVKASII